MASPLSTAEQVRSYIQDPFRAEDRTFFGDGTAARFGLSPHVNIQSASAFVVSADANGTGWSATGATFDATGWADFDVSISANTAVRFTYVHTVFSDDEIGHFTAVGGSVLGAALEATFRLEFDSLKRARWIAPDGSQFDDTMAMNQVWRLRSALEVRLESENIGLAAVQSWSTAQGDL